VQSPRASRAPVVVVAVFGIVATVLVIIGMQRPSEPPPQVEIAQAGTPAQPRDVTVIMRDYRFDPTPVVLVPGETVRFTILNGGLIDHDFVIGDEAVQRASGQQAVVEYTVPVGQQLALLCHIPGHIEKGMVGAVDLRNITISP
jgi:uncharacterized cupredoxin-like copper-binding protein